MITRHPFGRLLSIVFIMGMSITTIHAKADPHVILVVQKAGQQLATDLQIKLHLEAQHYQVELVDQTVEPTQFDPAQTHSAKTPDLIIISSTVAAKDLSPHWRQLAVPLLTWENDALDDLAMTAKRHDVDFGQTGKERYLWMVNAPHPMAAGLPAGLINVYTKQDSMSWGKPGLGAIIIATVYGQPEKAAIFGYEKGATMDYESLAPARRVMFFLDNETFGNLSTAGIQLFDAAVKWTIGK